MGDASAALLPAQLVPSRDPRGVLQVEGAVWAEPDIGIAAAHLRRLAEDPIERTALGARGRRMAQARLGLEALAAALHGIGMPTP